MRKLPRLASLFVIGSATLFACCTSSRAAEIKVLSAVALQTMLNEAATGFERATGHKLIVDYATAGVLADRIGSGEAADVTILPARFMEAVDKQGKTAPQSAAVVARTTVGVSVRAGAPKPDIGSVEAVKRSLLTAKSIVYADPTKGAASGIHFARVLERLGIVEEMKPKTRLIPGAGAAEVVANGEAELAISQTPDLLRIKGADYVGPLPPELQNTTDFVFSAVVLSGAKEPSAAKALIEYLRSPEAARVIRAKGLEPGQ